MLRRGKSLVDGRVESCNGIVPAKRPDWRAESPVEVTRKIMPLQPAQTFRHA